VSAIYGFTAGDMPDWGAKIIAVSDGDTAAGDRLAHDLGMELQSLALGPIWDPMAVRLCHAAGEGATLNCVLAVRPRPVSARQLMPQ